MNWKVKHNLYMHANPTAPPAPTVPKSPTAKPFPELASDSQNEEKILQDWKKKHIFEQSLKIKRKSANYIFYEGPPTANGRPGIHHLLSRAYKDLFVRFYFMCGYRVLRKAGWDCHGLPVEREVEKQLGITSKEEILRDEGGATKIQ